MTPGKPPATAGAGDAARNRRLAPLVSLAYEIYRDRDTARDPEPELPPREQVASPPWSYETYAQIVRGDIEARYSFPRRDFTRLLERARSAKPGPFTDSDCLAAVDLFDALMVRGLVIESSRGDTLGASRELAEQVPGLEKEIYARVISFMGYLNH